MFKLLSMWATQMLYFYKLLFKQYNYVCRWWGKRNIEWRLWLNAVKYSPYVYINVMVYIGISY